MGEVETALRERSTPPLSGLNPANIFRIQLAKGSSLDEDVLRRNKFILLAIESDKALVVSTEDGAFTELKRRLASYQSDGANGPKYGELDAIESLSVIQSEDRVGARLKANPLREGEIVPLDVELWHWDTQETCLRRIQELRAALSAPGMGVPDHWIGDGICIARIKTDKTQLTKILEWDAIRQIDRRPSPALSLADYFHLTASDVVPQPLVEDAVGILILDSGVASLHPLIGSVLGDAQAFPEAFLSKIGGSAVDEHGHGTAVAAIAAYGDLADAVRRGEFRPTARIFSARVLDRNNNYDEDALVETQMEAAFEYFFRNYPRIRVVNLSIGSSDDVLSDSRYQMRFAAVLDELARRYQDREIVFVVAAGNQSKLSAGSIEEEIANYPLSILNLSSRITDPGSAALALTVGGLSVGRIDNHQSDERAVRLVGQQAGNPSPFTRTGPGLNGAVKPELVAEAGDYLVESSGIIRDMGVLAANLDFARGEALFKPWIGTSFASPAVANLAARLTYEYPDYSSNLIRALLVHSAKVPSQRPGILADLNGDDAKVMRVYEYGRPDLERAMRAAANDAMMLQDSTIALDTFQILELPELPEDFVSRAGKRRIAITLAFDPPTRASRADSYLGVSMEFALWRNVGLDTLRETYRKWDRDEIDELDDDAAPPKLGEIKKHQIELLPKSSRRKTSTVQHAWKDISRSGDFMAGTPLYLVVVCQKKWAPASIERQRYAVVMSLFHEDESVNLQAQIRVQAKIRAAVRTRAAVR